MPDALGSALVSQACPGLPSAVGSILKPTPVNAPTTLTCGDRGGAGLHAAHSSALPQVVQRSVQQLDSHNRKVAIHYGSRCTPDRLSIAPAQALLVPAAGATSLVTVVCKSADQPSDSPQRVKALAKDVVDHKLAQEVAGHAHDSAHKGHGRLDEHCNRAVSRSGWLCCTIAKTHSPGNCGINVGAEGVPRR